MKLHHSKNVVLVIKNTQRRTDTLERMGLVNSVDRLTINKEPCDCEPGEFVLIEFNTRLEASKIAKNIPYYMNASIWKNGVLVADLS